MAADVSNMQSAGRILPIYRGEYDNSYPYEQLDIVLYNNSSYVAKRATVGNPPPTITNNDDNWIMIAKGIIDADISESKIEFSEAKERKNIESGEKSAAIMGKISKFFSDLKTVAFTGKYTDLNDKPFIPTVSNSAAVTQTGQMALDAIEKNAAVAGTLANQIAQQNSNLANKIERVYAVGDAISQIDFAPYHFGTYIVFTYRFTALVWRWSTTLRIKIIEQEERYVDSIISDGLSLQWNGTPNYTVVLKLADF